MDIVTTSSGFEYQLEPDAADDLEVFEAIKEASTEGTPDMDRADALFRAFRAIIGEGQEKKLRAFLKDRDGRVRTSAYRKEAEEVFSRLGKDKKK